MSVFALVTLAARAGTRAEHRKLDRTLNERAGRPGWSRVIVTLDPAANATARSRGLAGASGAGCR